MKRTEPTIPVYICTDGQENEAILLRDFNGYSTTIHAALLADNRLEVEEREFVRIPESLYNYWFKQIRKEVQTKKHLWTWHCYKNNIGLFWTHHARILATPELFFTPVPLCIGGVRPLYLGIMLQAWSKYPELFTVSCPACSSPMLIYNIYGLPNSGGYASAACPDCGQRRLDFADGQLLLRAGLLNHLCEQCMDDAYDLACLLTLEETIARLENEN